MAKIMEMPKLSDTMKEGAIAKWLAKEGDKVQAGIPVVEIETDKATMEYEAPTSGVLLKILVEAGQTGALQAPIAVIGKAGEDWQTALKEFEQKKSGKTPTAGTSVGAPEPQKATAPAVIQTPTQQAAHGKLKASPLARRVAQEKGLDLSKILGSGPQGRIVLRDLEKAPKAPLVSPARPAAPGALPESEKVPLTMMRKTIAARLVQSTTEAPQFYLTASVNVGPLFDWRKKALSRLPDDKKFSINDVLIFLVSRCLRKHPEVNSSWQGDHILRYNVVHMGVAVALPAGLVTPVIRNADALNVVDIAAQSRELAKLARDGKLQSEDYSGGTFSISNLGMYGIDEFNAIINPPQAAILAVGAAQATPVVDSTGALSTEQRIRLTLTCDHRVIDGATGAAFLKDLKETIEDPLSALFLS